MKSNGHLTFQCTIDKWSACSDEGVPGTILPCDVVATRGFSGHNCVCKKETKRLRQNLEIQV